jgi:murein DD-endopeptidase MepM/ murein hydrolase activator NlpD
MPNSSEVNMSNQHRLCCLFSVATLLSFNTMAMPVLMTDASIQNADQALDTPIRQLWDQRDALTKTLEQSGLVGHQAEATDHVQDGVGGNVEPHIGALESDSIENTIADLSRQAERRENSLNDMADSLSNRSYRATPSRDMNLGDLLAVEPVANAKVTSGYGYRYLGGHEFHPGIDLAVPYGTPVYATGSGVVVYAGWKNGYGNFIEIDHGNGYTTRYGHSSRLIVSVGQQVSKNQQISMVGCTGRCTGPHVHYEVLKDGKRQDPATYLALAPRRED